MHHPAVIAGQGLIVNIRGIGGSGKTELARCILRGYGWPRAGGIAAERVPGREHPIAYRLPHPLGGRPLAIIGHYERGSGGCDTIRASEGGLPLIFDRTAAFARAGHDVLLEGLVLSREVRRTAILAAGHRMHLIRLATPPAQCAQNLATRRRLGGRNREALERRAMSDHVDLLRACAALSEAEPAMRVSALPIDIALVHARTLLGFPPVQTEPVADPDPVTAWDSLAGNRRRLLRRAWRMR